LSDLWVADIVGKQWKAYETGPDYYDCWGAFCFAFLKKFNLVLDRHLEIPTANPMAFHRVVAKEIKTNNWVQITQLEDGCLVLMSEGRVWHHVGMWLDINGGRLLHSKEGLGVCLDNRHTLNNFNRVEYWKYVPTANTAASV